MNPGSNDELVVLALIDRYVLGGVEVREAAGLQRELTPE